MVLYISDAKNLDDVAGQILNFIAKEQIFQTTVVTGRPNVLKDGRSVVYRSNTITLVLLDSSIEKELISKLQNLFEKEKKRFKIPDMTKSDVFCIRYAEDPQLIICDKENREKPVDKLTIRIITKLDIISKLLISTTGPQGSLSKMRSTFQEKRDIDISEFIAIYDPKKILNVKSQFAGIDFTEDDFNIVKQCPPINKQPIILCGIFGIHLHFVQKVCKYDTLNTPLTMDLKSDIDFIQWEVLSAANWGKELPNFRNSLIPFNKVVSDEKKEFCAFSNVPLYDDCYVLEIISIDGNKLTRNNHILIHPVVFHNTNWNSSIVKTVDYKVLRTCSPVKFNDILLKYASDHEILKILAECKTFSMAKPFIEVNARKIAIIKELPEELFSLPKDITDIIYVKYCNIKL